MRGQHYYRKRTGMGWTIGAVGLVTLIAAIGWYTHQAKPQRLTRYNSTQSEIQIQTQNKAPSIDTAVETTSYTSRQGVVLRLDHRLDDTLLMNPATITGEVPGNWSFEASFPVELRDSAGKVIAQAPAQLQGDWMTTAYVPFTVTLNFAEPEESQTGKLILHKDNPSGLAEKEDEVTISVRLGTVK